MDTIDHKIIKILSQNARATVKQIAAQVALTSPAVSERIRRLEQSGVIAGYTVQLNPSLTKNYIDAFISVSVVPAERDSFLQALQNEAPVQVCYHVTGDHSHMVKVSCANMQSLEQLINRLQKFGITNTQIILSSTQTHNPLL